MNPIDFIKSLDKNIVIIISAIIGAITLFVIFFLGRRDKRKESFKESRNKFTSIMHDSIAKYEAPTKRPDAAVIFQELMHVHRPAYRTFRTAVETFKCNAISGLDEKWHEYDNGSQYPYTEYAADDNPEAIKAAKNKAVQRIMNILEYVNNL